MYSCHDSQSSITLLYFKTESNTINKGYKTTDKKKREDDETSIAKEISLQLSYYHILGHKRHLDFSQLADLNNHNSTYDKYEIDPVGIELMHPFQFHCLSNQLHLHLIS